MEVKVAKYKVPIIWLDTSILSNFQQYKSGESFKSIESKNIISHLYEIIYTLTRSKKLIFALGDQFEELQGRSKEELLERKRVATKLSLNIKMKYRQSIYDWQLKQGINAYLNKKTNLYFSAEEIFNNDPFLQLTKPKFFTVTIHSDRDYLLAKERNDQSQKFQIELEQVRQKIIDIGNHYEKHLQEEYLGRLRAIDFIKKRYDQVVSLISTHPEFIPYQNAMGPYYEFVDVINSGTYWIYKDLETMWKAANDLSIDPPYASLFEYYEEIKAFLISDVYKSLPYVDVSSKLTARIFSGQKKISSGDRMDISHLSTVVPFVDYIVTDKAMKHHLRTLKCDQLYNTDIFGSDLKELSTLIKQLEQL